MLSLKNLHKKLQMLTAVVMNLSIRKCNMTAFTGGMGERTLHFLKEMLDFHYLYVVPTKMDPSVLKGL